VLAPSHIQAGPAAVTYRVGPNGARISRTGSVTVGGSIHPVLQRGQPFTQVFSDTAANHPFADYINLLSDRGITTGCGGGRYCPEVPVTRAQTAVFLVRSRLGTDDFSYSLTPAFGDVQITHPLFKWVQKLRELGITAGCTAIAFCPDAPLPRTQMAVLVTRLALGLKDTDTFAFPPVPYFTDVPVTSPYFSYVQKLRQLGITAGCTATTFCPDDNLTRGQMAVFLIRAIVP
jgi:hypothetical protein